MSVLFVFIALYTALILHELGHYFTSKHFGLTVDCFTIGFGPTLFRFKSANTTFTFKLIPFMGYVSNDTKELNCISLLKEWAMTLSGVIINLLSSIVALSFVYQHNPLIIAKVLFTQAIPGVLNILFSTPLVGAEYSMQNTVSSLSTSIPADSFLLIFGVISFVMFLLNLIPIPLLDGGQLIMTPIRRWGVKHSKYAKTTEKISYLLYILSALVLFGPMLINELLDDPQGFLLVSIILLVLFLIDELKKKKVSKTPHS